MILHFKLYRLFSRFPNHLLMISQENMNFQIIYFYLNGEKENLVHAMRKTNCYCLIFKTLREVTYLINRLKYVQK